MKELIRILQDEAGNLYLECRGRTCLHQFNKKIVAKFIKKLKEVKK